MFNLTLADQITFVSIGSVGTYGHLAMAAEFTRICKLLSPNIQVRLLCEGSTFPNFLKENIELVINLPPRPQLCSRGGRLNANYTGNDILEIVNWENPGLWIFSTFFDTNLVSTLNQAGARCIWMGNPMRHSFWEMFQNDGFNLLFDETVLLDDIGTRNYIGSKKRLANVKITILPPPYYVRDEPSLTEDDSFKNDNIKIAVACGGGLINGSDVLFAKSVEILSNSLPDNVNLIVFPGDADVLEKRYSDSKIIISRDALTKHLPSCDLVICQAGYHTIHELLYFKVPAVIIPAPRLIDDQELRAICVSRATKMPMLLPSEILKLPEIVNGLLVYDGAPLKNIQRQIMNTVNSQKWDVTARSLWANFLKRNLAKKDN